MLDIVYCGKLMVRQNYPSPPIPAANSPRWYIKKPFGFSSFPKELAPLPRSWIETTGNLVYWADHKKVCQNKSAFASIYKPLLLTFERIQGGHFAALEQPEALKNDITEFVEQVWPEIASGH